MAKKSIISARIGGKKTAKKFYFLDIFILVLILCVLGVALFAYLPGVLSRFSGNTAEVEYTVCFLSPLDDATYNGLSSGNSVLWENTPFGTVKSVVTVEGEEEVYPDVERKEGYTTAKLTITVTAKVAETGIFVEGESLAIGKTLRLLLPAFTGDAVITDIRVGG